MEKSGNSKILRMVLSILIAVVLWMYVGKSLNPEDDKTIRNIPVTFAEVEALEERGLMISQGADQTVTIEVKARRDVLDQLNNSTVTATVDVSGIDRAGNYTQTYQISRNLSGTGSNGSYVVTNWQPLNVEFTVSALLERTIPIQGSFTGSVAEGFQTQGFTFSPESVKVRGEESLVNQIYYAQVILDQKDLSETYSGDLPFSFISFNGEEMSMDGLETSVSLIRTTLPVVQLKKVPLTVNILPGGGATEENITYEIDPSSIMVSGPSEVLEPVKEISLGDIDLSKVLGSDTITRPIELAAELTNESGISEAKVKVKLRGLTTAVLEVDNIDFINTPEGYEPEKVTQSRQVTIRGSAEAVASVTASQLRIVADLSQISNVATATGAQTVPVKVYLDGRSDVGVVGEYNISVSMRRQGENP